jgi:hypothetical protein
MEPNTREKLIASAVTIGSLLLIGPLTYFLLVKMVESLTSLVGVGPVNGWAALVVIIGAVAIALGTASVVATIRIRGYQALRRGSRNRVFIRHAALAAPVIAATVLIADLVAYAIQWGLDRNAVGILAVSLLIIAAVVWTAVRFVKFYQQGRQPTS